MQKNIEYFLKILNNEFCKSLRLHFLHEKNKRTLFISINKAGWSLLNYPSFALNTAN